MKLTFFVILVGFTSCSSNERSQENKSENETNVASKQECYGYFANRDTLMLSFKRLGGDSITGNLVYDFYEKDGSHGPINGTLQNDLLLARYTFQSEGMTSVRQVAFKKSGDGWVEGFGDVTEQNSEMIFKDTKSLQYNERFKLTPIECK